MRETIALPFLALVLVAGCTTPSQAPGGRSSALVDSAAPRAVLAEWHRTLTGGDKSEYIACFVESEEELVLAFAMFEAVQASYEFHRAVVTAYGAEAWQVFETSPTGRVPLFPREPAWVGRITVVRTGPSAMAYIPKGRVPMHVVEIDGRWSIQAASLVPPGLEARQASNYLFRWAASLRQLIPGIGAKTLAAEKANRDYTEDFKARVGAAEQPAAADAVDAFLAH